MAEFAPDPPSRTTAFPEAPLDDAWHANAAAVVAWIRAGGFPATGREDLLRDIVALWDGFPPDDGAWETIAALLATLAGIRDAPGPGAPAFAALADLAEQLDGCAAGDVGAEEKAVAAVRRAATHLHAAARA